MGLNYSQMFFISCSFRVLKLFVEIILLLKFFVEKNKAYKAKNGQIKELIGQREINLKYSLGVIPYSCLNARKKLL